MSNPNPRRAVLSVSILPKSIDDWEKLQRALGALSQQDRDMTFAADFTDRRTIVRGIDELHLEDICDRIEREFNVPLDSVIPEVIYLETIRKPSEAEGRYIRQVGGRGQYAEVKLGVEPTGPENEYQFVDKSSDSAVPRQFVESIDSGIREAMKAGVLAGHEIVGLRAALTGGSYHEEDSNEMAFKIAAFTALKEACRKANPVVLEPIMSVDVDAPEDYAGAIIGDLSRRRGRIEGMEHRADSVRICAVVPLAELLGYSSHLRSLTQGRASYSTKFVRYEAVPKRGGAGPEEIGVPAKTPKWPENKTGRAAANPNEAFE